MYKVVVVVDKLILIKSFQILEARWLEQTWNTKYIDVWPDVLHLGKTKNVNPMKLKFNSLVLTFVGCVMVTPMLTSML